MKNWLWIRPALTILFTLINLVVITVCTIFLSIDQNLKYKASNLIIDEPYAYITYTIKDETATQVSKHLRFKVENISVPENVAACFEISMPIELQANQENIIIFNYKEDFIPPTNFQEYLEFKNQFLDDIITIQLKVEIVWTKGTN